MEGQWHQRKYLYSPFLAEKLSDCVPSPENPQRAEGNLSCCTLSPYLHHSVIDRDEICEQVQVAGCEDEGKKYLTLPRDSCMAGR